MFTRLLNAPAYLQTLVALALLGIQVLVAVLVAQTFASDIVQRRDFLLQTRERAGKMMQLAAIDLAAPRNLSDSQHETGKLFKEPPSLAIARADFQQQVTDIAIRNGTSVASAGNLPDRDEADVTMIGLRVIFSGANDAVARTILNLETVAPPLIIKEINVHSAETGQPNQPIQLTAQLHVYTAVRIVQASRGTK